MEAAAVMDDLFSSQLEAIDDPDELERQRAVLGIVPELPVAAFTGGYAESEERTAYRADNSRASRTGTLRSRGLKDVPLTFTLPERDEFLDMVGIIRQNNPAVQDTAGAVLHALREVTRGA